MPRFAPAHVAFAAYAGGLCLSLTGLSWPAAVLMAVVPMAAVASVATLSTHRLVEAVTRPASPRATVSAMPQPFSGGPLPGPSDEPFDRAARAARWQRLVRLAALGGLLVVAGFVVGHGRLAMVRQSVLRSLLYESVPVRVTVLDLPRGDNRRVQLTVQVTRAAGRPVAERAEFELKRGHGEEWPVAALVEGTMLEIPHARVEPLPEPRRGAFDYARYLERRGEHVVLAAPLASARVVGRRSGLTGLIDRLRLAARERLNAGLSPPVGPVLQGMVLGDDEAVDEGTIADFRRSGLLHIMAVSGENVVLLCSMWSFVLLLLGVPRTARLVALLPIIAAYVIVTGASPSIMRAGVAGCMACLAALVSRPSDGWLLWLIPAAVLLTLNPYTLLDVSFQLSFAAVAGLLLLSRRLTEGLRFLPGPLAEQAGVTSAATIATAPVSLMTFGQASLVAVPANMAGGFALGPIMFLGMISVVAGLVVPVLSLPVNVLNGLCIAFLLQVAAWFGDLSFAVYEWHGPTLTVTLLAGAAGEALVLQRLARRTGLSLPAFLARLVRSGSGRLRLAGGTALVGLLVAVATPAPPAAPRAATLSFLDVGEGAATLIQVPNGPTILVDAGPAPLGDQLRAHGVRRVDLLVLSHGHADHTAGLSDVVGSLPIAAAVLPQPPQPSRTLDELTASLTAHGCSVRRCTAALALNAGPLRLEILPTASQESEGNQSENDHALVVVARLGSEDVLLPGDAEMPALSPLGLGPLAYVELPHHGSADGFDERLLREYEPRLAVVSVGEDNTYGHPSPSMLSLMAQTGIPVLRTDQVGEIDLVLGARGLVVEVARPPPSH